MCFSFLKLNLTVLFQIIQSITSNVPHEGIFNFSSTTVKGVNDLLNRTDPTKAIGYDDIPPKLLKLGATELAPTITNLINQSIVKYRFRTALKKWESSPLYKNKDNLITVNHRPLSMLPSVSKIFEKVFNQQLYDYIKRILSGLSSAFRQKYGCHHVLTRLIKDCKRALDKHMHVGLLLLDLSKAFDCLPHKLLLCKLHAYGVSRDACDLLCSYFTNRTQRVKMYTVKIDWAKLIKGVPQGSVLGPMMFNIFINDLTYVVENTCPLYNYADDNTLGFWHNELDELKLNFENGSKIAIERFQENHMKVNVSKFQSIILKPKGVISDVEFHVSGHSLKPVSSVKLLGVRIDERLTFDDHIYALCAKASYQINALRRIVKYLTPENRMSIYNAYMHSNFNYCNTVWHFCSNRSLYELEKLHKQALR